MPSIDDRKMLAGVAEVCAALEYDAEVEGGAGTWAVPDVDFEFELEAAVDDGDLLGALGARFASA